MVANKKENLAVVMVVRNQANLKDCWETLASKNRNTAIVVEVVMVLHTEVNWKDFEVTLAYWNHNMSVVDLLVMV